MTYLPGECSYRRAESVGRLNVGGVGVAPLPPCLARRVVLAPSGEATHHAGRHTAVRLVECEHHIPQEAVPAAVQRVELRGVAAQVELESRS